MANDAKKQIFADLVDPVPQTSQKNSSKKRFRRCKSAPTDFMPPQQNGSLHNKPSISIFKKFHPSFRQVVFFFALYLGLGVICFEIIKDQIKGSKTNGVVDALYFCIVTMSTVGYGDLVPHTVTSKLFACAFVFAGMAIVGLILTKSADYLVEKQETLLIKALPISKKVGGTKIVKEITNNKVKYKLFVTIAVILVLTMIGTLVLWRVEKMDLVDAFYCVCCTITTLGYGDKSFSSLGGRIFAVFWILTGTVCLAQCFLYLAELKTEHRQRSLVKWVLRRRMTYVDIDAADLDEDGVVSAAEFVIYKLKEMGKISQEDIEIVMEEFEDLEVDHNGKLSAHDIALAQISETGT